MSNIDEKAFQVAFDKVPSIKAYPCGPLLDFMRAYEAAKTPTTDQPYTMPVRTACVQCGQNVKADGSCKCVTGVISIAPNDQPVGLSEIDQEVARILALTDEEVIAEAGGEENAKIVASHVRRIFDKVKLQVAIAKAIHYPACWDTMAYPTLFDALHELAGCVGCSECKHPGNNPDADQRPSERELSIEDRQEVIRILANVYNDPSLEMPTCPYNETEVRMAEAVARLLERFDIRRRG